MLTCPYQYVFYFYFYFLLFIVESVILYDLLQSDLPINFDDAEKC